MNNEELISSTIFWKKHPEIGYYYYNEEYDKLILLRMNNFPEEALYTLINGLDITDLEDKPTGWNLERH
ncbi:hypothetical protein I6I99_05430 [Sphingobacterium multivorum]|uniref:Uncharacterized protein n=1 Tax=Sphingobacterium multivorum TaxID=28454 RepID=A0ABX7CIZ0_SPHMU|nr:hypothetical protein [Sphingobacterium multivorum]QQT32014.1 hypothetical protein I6I99_05430 [Sphingobacterium multivorum]QQT52064.1 hypothetical protein I6I98_17540 [Sphingobacterium multivorum]